MQTTYGYYVGEYAGDVIPEQDFKKAKKQAEAYIRHLTYTRGDIFVEENEAVNDAVCAVAERKQRNWTINMISMYQIKIQRSSSRIRSHSQMETVSREETTRNSMVKENIPIPEGSRA